MIIGYNLRLTNFARDVIYHDFLYSAKPSKLKVGGTDENLLKEGDGGSLFHRSGDNIFTPEAYTFNATIIGDSALDVRNKINAISDALEQSEAIEIISAAMTTYVITLSNSDVDFRHHIAVKNIQHGIHAVNLTITVNIASTFVTVIPAGASVPTAALDLNAASKVFSDTAATTAATDTDLVEVWQNDVADQYHARQAITTFKLSYDDSTFGFPTLKTDGTTNYMEIDDYDWGTSGGTLFAVIKQIDVTKDDFDRSILSWKALATGQATKNMYADIDGAQELNANIDGAGSIEARRRPNNWYIQSMINDPTNAVDGFKLFVNGVQVASAPGATPLAIDPATKAVIGAAISGTSKVDGFEGWMQRFKFFEEVLTLEQHSTVVEELMSANSSIKNQKPGGVDVDMWLDPDEDVYSDTGSVAAVATVRPGPTVGAWSDQSINALGALATNGGSIIPTYEIIDGVNALGFDNDNFFLSYGGDFKTVLIVLKYFESSTSDTSVLSTRKLVGGGPNFLIRVYDNSDETLSVEGEGLPTLTFPAPVDEWYLLTFRFDDTTAELRINDTVVATGAVSSRVAPVWQVSRPPALGAGYIGSTSESERMEGWIRDVVVANRRLGDTELASVTTAIQAKNSSLLPSALSGILTTGLQLDFDVEQDVYTDAGTTVATVGQAVQQVNDQSGQGNNATQLVAADKALLQTVDGGRALVFDGTDDYYDHTYVDQARTIYIVAKYTDAVDNAASMVSCSSTIGGVSAYTFHANEGTGFARWTRQQTPFPQATKVVGSWAIYCATYNSTSKTKNLYIDGEFKDTTTSGATRNPGTKAVIGCRAIDPEPTIDQFFTGAIHRVLIYDVEHSPAEVIAMNNFLKSELSFL